MTTTTPIHTTASLRAMPLRERYDALRECVEDGSRFDPDESLLHDLAPLCSRATWPKGREHPTLANYARANRWNFPRGPRAIGDKLPPSLAASSPDALYRLMHVFRPVVKMRDRDFYQTGVFRIYSAGRRFACVVAFQKRELELGFYCPRADLFVPEEPQFPQEIAAAVHADESRYYTDAAHRAAVIAAHRPAWDAHRAAEEAYREQGEVVPWSSGLMRCANPTGQAWARLVVAVANTAWDLYPGNGFKV